MPQGIMVFNNPSILMFNLSTRCIPGDCFEEASHSREISRGGDSQQKKREKCQWLVLGVQCVSGILVLLGDFLRG